MELKKLDDKSKAKEILKLQAEHERVRSDYEDLWQDIIDFVSPDLYNFKQDKQKGQKVGTSIYDGTPISALNLLADGLHGYLVSPAIKWFGLLLPMTWKWPRTSAMRQWDGRLDAIPEVKKWLQDKEEVMYSSFQRSNFYEAMAEYFRKGGSIGTATVYSEEDIISGRTLFSTRNPGEIFISENMFGTVDTHFRKFKYNARKAVQRFGRDNVATNVQSAYDNGRFSEEFEYVHACFPRDDSEFYIARDGSVTRKLDSRNMAFASYYIEVATQNLMSESGYNVNPFHTWRWRCNTEEVYGRSPAADAIVDILMLNQVAKTMLNAAQMAVEPPFLIPASMRGRAPIKPRGRIYYGTAAEADIRQLVEQINYPFGIDREDKIQRRIEEHFRVEFFLMLARAEKQMTATEIIEKQGEKAAVLGSTIGRLTTECLNPIIDRVDMMETEAGRMPPPPDILFEFAGANIDIDYLGPLAVAQKRLFKTQGIQAALSTISPVMEVVPEVKDVIDWDELARELLSVTGMPSKCILPTDKVATIRQGRAQAIQQQQQMEMLERMGKVLPGASKSIEEGSALDLLSNTAAEGMLQ